MNESESESRARARERARIITEKRITLIDHGSFLIGENISKEEFNNNGSKVILYTLVPNIRKWKTLATNFVRYANIINEDEMPTLRGFLLSMDYTFSESKKDIGNNINNVLGFATEEYCLMLGNGVNSNGEKIYVFTAGHNIARVGGPASKWGYHTLGRSGNAQSQIHAEIIALYAQYEVLIPERDNEREGITDFTIEQVITKNNACDACVSEFIEIENFWQDHGVTLAGLSEVPIVRQARVVNVPVDENGKPLSKNAIKKRNTARLKAEKKARKKRS